MSQFHVIPLETDSYQQPVIDIISTEPASPNKGNRYIVNIGGSGAFTGHDNHIAWFDGSSWQFIIPKTGWITYILSRNDFYKFDGTNWVSYSSLYYGIDEKVKADSNDPNPGYLSGKVDNVTIEVDTTNHVIKIKKVGATELDQSDTYDFATNGGTILVKDPSLDNEVVNLKTVRDLLNSLESGRDFQDSVNAIQTDNTLDPGTSHNNSDRYIITDPNNLHPNFGTITGLEANDIIQWKDDHWEVVFDISASPDPIGATVYVEDLDRYYTYNGTSWVNTGNVTIHNSLSGLQGGNGNDQFYHLSQSEHDLLTTGQEASSLHHHNNLYQKTGRYDQDLGAIIFDIIF